MQLEWNQDDGRDFYGKATYEFTLAADYPVRIDISAEEIDQVSFWSSRLPIYSLTKTFPSKQRLILSPMLSRRKYQNSPSSCKLFS